MAAVVTSVPFTLSGVVTIPGIGVISGVSTSFSMQTLPATPAPEPTTSARAPLIDPPVRNPTSSSTSSVSSSSAVPTSSSIPTTSSTSTSSTQRTLTLATPTSTAEPTTSETTSSSSRSSASASSSTRSSSAATASPSRAVAAAGSKPGELSTLARSLIIAGAVVGGLLILALIIGFFLRRLRRKRRNEDEQLGSELQDQGGKGAYGGSTGYGSAAGGGWGAGNDDDDQYHEKPVAAGAAGFGSGGAFVNALGRDGRPASPAGPGALYGAGYAASDVSLHGQALGTDHMGGGGAMYGVDVSNGNQSYNGLGHGYPPTSPYYDGQQQSQSAPGQYFANQGQQQQPYGADAYSAYPAVPSTVALASAYPDQSYDNLTAPAQPYTASSVPAAAPTAVATESSTPMRVVRGFQASLADELPIQPFTTLNLLQTYDDGWCLCEDPETGRQGVVPRDCLAAPELVNGQMETGARALTPTAGRAASPVVSAPLPAPPGPAAGPPAPVVDEKRALAAAAAMAYASGTGSGAADEEPEPIPYAEEDPNGPARPLPTLPPPSFSESNLAAVAEGSSSAGAALPANEYPREKAVALGAPLSTTAAATAPAAPPRLDLEFGAGAGQKSAPSASGSGFPRLDTSSSLAVSERQERRSSLMDSIAAAGAYLEGNGAPAAGQHSHAQ